MFLFSFVSEEEALGDVVSTKIGGKRAQDHNSVSWTNSTKTFNIVNVQNSNDWIDTAIKASRLVFQLNCLFCMRYIESTKEWVTACNSNRSRLISAQCVKCMLLFLVLVGNSAQFRILRSYMLLFKLSCPFLCVLGYICSISPQCSWWGQENILNTALLRERRYSLHWPSWFCDTTIHLCSLWSSLRLFSHLTHVLGIQTDIWNVRCN